MTLLQSVRRILEENMEENEKEESEEPNSVRF
jgi:hypothetical protein